MSLRLANANAGQIAPRASSPARQRLVEHGERIGAIQRELEVLNAKLLAADAAEQAAHVAQAALDAVGELEGEKWREFVSAGAQGTPPAPLMALRMDRANDLAAARARAELAQQEADDVRPRIAALDQERAELAPQARKLVNGVLLEEAADIGARLCLANADVTACTAALRGIAESLVANGGGHAVEAVGDLLQGGRCGHALVVQREAEASHFRSVRTQFATLGSLIASDPAASIELRLFIPGIAK